MKVQIYWDPGEHKIRDTVKKQLQVDRLDLSKFVYI